ncbi:MAG: nucleotidyltransferase family protein [Desulfomonilaceae bacterium]|nr:nucleotidyltransferase family protein [Desulfomonilaceae bacterium]
MSEAILPFTAMVLAGGLGTRLRSVVSDRPKPMAMIGRVPFLEILIGYLAREGVRRFVLLTGHMGEMIEEYFQRSFREGVDVRCRREESPLGTGGAVKNAQEFATDPTLLVNGDTFFAADVKSLYRFHQDKNAGVTLSLRYVSDVSRYGSVILNENGMITGFREKDPGAVGPGWVNAGLSLLSYETIQGLPSGRTFSMETEIFPKFVGSGRMAGLPQDGAFFDIGTPESYEAFKAYVDEARIDFQTV